MLPAGTTLRHCSTIHGFTDFEELSQSNHGTAGNCEAGGSVNHAVSVNISVCVCMCISIKHCVNSDVNTENGSERNVNVDVDDDVDSSVTFEQGLSVYL